MPHPTQQPLPRHKPVIGLLGGIGSGKSTVAKLFASLGCGVIDADDLAKKALEGESVRAQVRAAFGPGVFAADGAVSRPALAAVVFGDATKLAALEAISHPVVHAERRAARERFERDPSIVAIVEDCPLLLEKSLEREVDVLVFVDSSLEKRLERVAARRGWTRAQLEERENRQLGLDIKANRAQYVIENNASEAQCLGHVRDVLSKILEAQTRTAPSKGGTA